MDTKKINNRQGNKKIALLLVLKALEEMSDERHPIKQITLAKMVNGIGEALDVDVYCDRKTIGRHLKLLTAAGYKITVVKGQGCYLESSKFTKQESEIIASVIRKSSLLEGSKDQLIAKLNAQQTKLDINTLKKYINCSS